MAETLNRGPNGSLGALIGNVNIQAGTGVALIEPTDGPSFSYQGYGLPDARYSPINKDSLKQARVPVFSGADNFSLVDAIPEAVTTANIAASQHITASTPMTLVTVCAGGGAASTFFSHGCPAIVPFRATPANIGNSFPPSGVAGALATYQSGSTTAVSGVLALDFGFSVGSTTAGSGSVTSVPSPGAFFVGQWICIGGAGNAGKTTGLITQVTAVGSTTITISPVALGTLTAAPIGNANFNGPFPAYPQGIADAASPYTPAGVAALFHPTESIARVVRIIASSASATGGTFTIAGYDVYGMAMTETIVSTPATDTSQTAFGLKAWKYISSITPSNTDGTFNYTVGTTDVYGIHMFAPEWDILTVTWNALLMTSSTGFVVPVRTTPATAATGDVRGTIQTGAVGGGTGIGSTASNGTIRLTIAYRPKPAQMAATTPVTVTPLFGVAQA